jgi:hypothetical protein
MAQKPVVTTRDSGAPLDVVRDRETGLVTEPRAAELAGAFRFLLDNETDARRALALAKRHKAHCFLGRENARPNRNDYVIEYWEGASGVPTRIDVEDCVPLDRPSLRIADLGAAGWVLADSRARLLLADSRDDARRAWEIAQRSSALCFIGRGNGRTNQRDYLVQYWR